MDEIELRLAAVETALIHLVPWLEPGAIEDAIADLPDTAGGDERTIRKAAAQLLRDGYGRFRQVRPSDILGGG
jgi:hypothetical protein